MTSNASLSSGVRLPLPKELRKFLQPLLQKAYGAQRTVYLVGGCVRDLLLGVEPGDIDVVVEGPAAPLVRGAARRYKAKLVSHAAFLTYTLHLSNGRRLDV